MRVDVSVSIDLEDLDFSDILNFVEGEVRRFSAEKAEFKEVFSEILEEHVEEVRPEFENEAFIKGLTLIEKLKFDFFMDNFDRINIEDLEAING